MDLNLQSFNYSLFGNFKEVMLNMGIVKKLFLDASISNITTNLSSSATYLIKNDDFKALVNVNRIDFFNEPNTNIDTNKIENFVRILESKITLTIDRIALNCGMFIKDENGTIANSINNSFQLLKTNNDDELSELVIRQNLYFSYKGKTFNNILTLGKANVQNNLSFEIYNVFALNFDINSMAAENYSFNSFELSDYFNKLYDVFSSRKDFLLENLKAILGE